MIVGVLINEIGLMAGISTPLSVMPLITVITIILLLLSLVGPASKREYSYQFMNGLKSIFSKPLVYPIASICILAFFINQWLFFRHENFLFYLIPDLGIIGPAIPVSLESLTHALNIITRIHCLWDPSESISEQRI